MYFHQNLTNTWEHFKILYYDDVGGKDILSPMLHERISLYMDTTITKRQQQAIETKEKIYNVCIELIQKNGYEQLSISDICKHAGISVGCFYHHFKSKENIIIEVYQRADQVASAQIKEVIHTGTWNEKILNIFQIQMQGFKDAGIDFVTQLYKSQITEESDFLFSNERVMPQILTQILNSAQAEGYITKNYSADFIAQELMRFSRGVVYDWCLHKGSYDIEEKMAAAMSVYLNSFLK